MSGQTPERRSRLRQYQVQLLERMQAAKAGPAAGARELGVLIGARLCLLDLTHISEIVWLPAVTPVPLTHDWYQGLANIRGNLTGVIDLARYQGAPAEALSSAPAAAAAQRRLITFAPVLGFNCALLAEGVLGLRKLGDMQPAPAGADDTAAWCDQQFDDAEGQRWTRIDLARLVLEPRFLQVGL